MACTSLRLLLGNLIILVALLLPPAISCPCAAQAQSGEQKHFVLVHGLGHGAWCWYKTITLLQQAGHHTTAIDLASNGISKVIADNITSIAQYCQPLTNFLANEIQTPTKVILVGHSLGGSAISYAMEQYPKKIEKAIFVGSFMPSNNQTFIPNDFSPRFQELLQEGYFIQNFGNGPSMPPTSVYANLSLVEDFFYKSSPLEDINLARHSLNPSPFMPLTQVLTLTPSRYGSIERFYIKIGRDQAIWISFQESFTQNNPPNEVFLISQSDHSPFFSSPILLHNLLLSIVSSTNSTLSSIQVCSIRDHVDKNLWPQA